MALSVWLGTHYELPFIPILYAVSATITVYLLGQAAVIGPALQGAAIFPGTAIRGGS